MIKMLLPHKPKHNTTEIQYRKVKKLNLKVSFKLILEINSVWKDIIIDKQAVDDVNNNTQNLFVSQVLITNKLIFVLFFIGRKLVSSQRWSKLPYLNV